MDDEYTTITIDQTRQVLSTLIYAWFPEGERPSLPVTGKWDSLKLFGAVSDAGETFFVPCEENFNGDTTIRLLDALQTEFGEKICAVLDNASYFTANAVQEFVEDTPIELCYLPRGSPELNPVFFLMDCGTEQRYVVPAKSADESTIRLLLTDHQQEPFTVYTDGFCAYDSLTKMVNSTANTSFMETVSTPTRRSM